MTRKYNTRHADVFFRHFTKGIVCSSTSGFGLWRIRGISRVKSGVCVWGGAFVWCRTFGVDRKGVKAEAPVDPESSLCRGIGPCTIKGSVGETTK